MSERTLKSVGLETLTSLGTLVGTADAATPNDTDIVVTALTAGGIIKKITWTAVKAFLKTYFDGVYNPILAEVDGSTAITLTAAQCKNKIVNNYGQAAADVALILPAAAAGLRFKAVVGTTQAGNTWKLTAGAGDKIYLNGTGGTDAQSVIVTPAIGNSIELSTFKTGASAYDWIAITDAGTWTAGA